MAIDIGTGATDLGSQTEVAVAGETHIDTFNSANATGNIDTFQINLRSWGGNMANCKMGTCSGSGTSWTSRDFVSLGTITAGSTQTFSGQTCDVVLGDRIIVYGDTAGYLIVNTNITDPPGHSVGIYAGDGFTGSPVTYTMQSNWGAALYGTGTEAGGAIRKKFNQSIWIGG